LQQILGGYNDGPAYRDNSHIKIGEFSAKLILRFSGFNESFSGKTKNITP
jgi:hypothetical protein